ncbi:hypothetical protein ACIBVL_09675 [Streptomyces sp. NPDC049687]|uniref:hypothetical protein n=1 Tax=Streptomyces sp. NPDC049687 TaxID=3365596 RepID=UPI0037AB3615
MRTTTTTSGREVTTRGMRLTVALAACALALTPWAAQADAQAAPSKTQWKLASPLSESESTHFLDIDATSRTDAWAVGGQEDGMGSWVPVARHWDGTRWSCVRLPGMEGRQARLEKVAASGPDDIWAAGAYTDADLGAASLTGLPDRLADRVRRGAALPAVDSPIVLQHWDGTRWKRVPRPAPAEGYVGFVGELTSLGPDSVWLTTFDWNPETGHTTGRLERWDGRAWRQLPLPPAPDGSPVQPWDITGSGPDDVWVGADAGTDTTTPLLYHFDGRRWSVRTVPVPHEYGPGWVAGQIVTTKRGTVHVFGKANDPQVPSGLFAARWDGRAWQSLPLPGVDEVTAVGKDGSGSVWIGGRPQGSDHAVLSRWNGSAWAQEALPEELTSTSVGSTLVGIDGVPGTRTVLAAGDAGCESPTSACGLLLSRGTY